MPAVLSVYDVSAADRAALPTKFQWIAWRFRQKFNGSRGVQEEATDQGTEMSALSKANVRFSIFFFMMNTKR